MIAPVFHSRRDDDRPHPQKEEHKKVKLAAVIVESRSLRELYEVIANHLNHLPDGTDLVWFTSIDAYKKRNADIQTLFGSNRKVHFHIRAIDSIGDYNRLLTSPEFWEKLCGWEKVLIFQHDSRMLRKGIEAFYDFDYIGADWRWNPHHPGNGGASLRTPEVMLKVCQSFAWDGQLNEDHWLTDKMFSWKIGKLATKEEARTFSVEAVFGLGSLMTHAPEKWLTKEECEQIKNQYK